MAIQTEARQDEVRRGRFGKEMMVVKRVFVPGDTDFDGCVGGEASWVVRKKFDAEGFAVPEVVGLLERLCPWWRRSGAGERVLEDLGAALPKLVWACPR
jgi:hypothetical protein